MNILAVIPARGGSKGIPKKNIRLMNGKPLISYAIMNSLNSKYITDVVLTTDSEEISYVGEKFGAKVIMRGKDLSDDITTLDPVIYDALIKTEKSEGKKYDIVITLQATSPLLKVETLDKAIEKFINSNNDTIISVTNKPHLAWGKQKGKIVPLYKERVNRQQLPANYVETGAFLITKRECMNKNTRIGNNISIYEVSEEESNDIDTISDWMVCESLLKKKKIILRCDGNKKIGMGHVYHCLTLAYALTGNDIMIVTNQSCKPGLKKIKESYIPYVTINDNSEFFEFIKKYKPDIIVNDCLDTEEEYVKTLKKLCKRVITIEDMGEGSKYADVVINALYEEKNNPNVFCGEQYVCLRNEFLISKPKEFNNKVENVLILFGGTDPSNLTKKLYDVVKHNYKNYPNIKYTFITGIGYDCEKNNIETNEKYNIKVVKDVNNISEYMAEADIAFTSQGRTVYELASMGVPSIVLAQNNRELLHTFAQMTNGFVNLGLGKEVAIETIQNTLEWLVQTPQIRKEMRELMLKKDLKSGLDREVNLILNGAGE